MSNLAVKITADIVDLQTKFAVAKAEVQGLTSEMNKLARASATGTIDAAGTARLQQLSSNLITARQAAGGYASALEKAGVSTGSLTRATEGMSHGAISTATREFRALFDELSSGRTRNTPGTLAIIANRVFGLGPAGLGAVAGIAALAGGLAYLAIKAVEAGRALDQMHLDSLRAGNDESRASIAALASQLAQLPSVSQSAGTEIVSALAGVHMPFDALQAAARIAAEQMVQTGQKGQAVGEQIAKALSAETSATELAKKMQGELTQAQVDAAIAADKSGNETAILAEKLQLLQIPLNKGRQAVKEYSGAWTDALGRALFVASAATASANTLTSAMRVGTESDAQAWQQNATAIRQYGAALSTLPAEQQLNFDKNGDEDLEKQLQLERELGDTKKHIAEQEIEDAGRTLDAIEQAQRQAQEQQDAIGRQDAEASIQLSRMKIEAEKDTLNQSVTANDAAAGQKYTRLKQLTDQEYQLDLQQLQNELLTLKDQPVEYDRVYNQIRELKQRNVLDLAQLDQQYAAESAKGVKLQASLWRGSVDEIESAESGMVSNLLTKRKTLSESLIQLSSQLVEKEISNDLRAVTTRILLHQTATATEKALEQGGYIYHLATELEKTGTTTAQQAAQTTATAAGNATRLASQTSAATAGKAIQSASGVATVMSDAAQAFAGTYASVSSIPVVGWAIAPGAAASAYATVASMAGMASLDVGAWNVPADMVAQIHKGESVVPTTFAQGLRQNGGFGGGDSGGGETHNHYYDIHASDAKSFSALISQPNNRQSMVKALRSHLGR